MSHNATVPCPSCGNPMSSKARHCRPCSFAMRRNVGVAGAPLFEPPDGDTRESTVPLDLDNRDDRLAYERWLDRH